MKDINFFLKEHGIRAADIDIQNFVDIITAEMVNGLQGPESSLRMIPTYIEADNQFLREIPVLAIDAGGTNFRAAIIRFNKQGSLEISDIINKRMPGIDGEISKDEFFETIAGYVRPLAERCERIGFCFSYPSEILPDKDGILLQFCKEVQAPGVVGELIGKNLLNALKMNDKQVVLLNDTVATLLAGKSASVGKNFDSFIGFILGTGTNTCYIEGNANITKKCGLDLRKSQIINIESGNFGKAKQTDIDTLFDNTTVNPGDYTFEKMISGGYIGSLCLVALKKAAEEDMFSAKTSVGIKTLKELSTEEINLYLSNSGSDRGSLLKYIKSKNDEESCVIIVESIIERAAKLVAAIIAAVLLKTGKGKSPDRPVLITVEGSTYYKLKNLKSLSEIYLREYLSEEKKRYYEFTEVPQSSLAGAALAALIN